MTLEECKSRAINQLKIHFNGYATHDLVYKIGGVLTLFFVIIGFFINILLGFSSLQLVIQALIIIVGFIFTVAVLMEYSKPTIKLLTNNWVKLFLAAISIPIYKYSEMHADIFINKLTKIDPGLLPKASSMLATIFLPYSWLMVASILLASFIMFNWLFIPFEKTLTRKLGAGKYLARFWGLFTILLLTTKSIGLIDYSNPFINSLAKDITLSTEYFRNSHCVNINNGEFSAYLVDNYISIYNAKENTFRTEYCKIDITKN